MSVLVRLNVLRPIFSIIPRRASHDEAQVKPFHEIPGPSFRDSWRYRYGESTSCRLHLAYSKMYEEFGPLVKDMINPERSTVHAFDAQDIQKVYINEGKFPMRPSHTALAHYRENHPETYSCAGLISNDGESWHRFRRLFNSTLTNENIVNKFLGDMEDVTEDLMARIAAELDGNNEVDITPLVLKWSLDTIGTITLNVRFGCLSAEGNEEAMTLLDAAKDIHEYVYLTENFSDPDGHNYKENARAQQKLEKIVQKHMQKAIDDIEKGKHGESLLALLLQREGASRKDVLTLAVDMITGGTDTVSVALVFSLYNLAINPSVQDALRDDLKQLPSKTARVSLTHPFDSSYTMNVLKESFRVNPTGIGNGRIIPTDLVLSGYMVPAKTPVILQHQVASKQEKYFRDAHLFNPLRWKSKDIVPLVSSPFGSGKRKCIGHIIAKKELTIAVARIIRNFKVSYHHEPVDTINRLVNVPDRPVRLRFTPTES